MTEASEQLILTTLKTDLHQSNTVMDGYLMQLIRAAQDFIKKEGIVLTDSFGDCQLVEMYAAYLFRRRREENTAMPRALRWALNNRRISEPMGEE